MQKTQKLIFFSVVGLFVYMPFHIFLSQWLSTFTGYLDVWKIGKDVFAWAILIFGSTLVIYAKKASRLFWILWGLLLAYTAIHAILYAATDQPIKTGVLAMIYNTRLMWFVLIAYNLSLLVKDKAKLLKQFTKYLLVVSTIVCVVALLQWVLPKDIMTHFGYSIERGVKPAFFIDDKPDLPRVMSTIRDPNSLGAFLILPILLLVNLLIKNYKTDKKTLLSGVLMLHFLILFLTFSRGAWLGIVLAGGLYLGITYRKEATKYAVKYKYIIIALALIFGLFTYAMRDQYIVQNVLLHSDENTKLEDSNSLHVSLIKKGVNGIADQPEGHGPGTAGLISIQLDKGIEVKPSRQVAPDEVSPSVVKIYHFVCGSLVLNGQVLTDDTCDGNVGSGFFVSGNGIIATNGHVVTLTPVDFLANIVSSSPENTKQLLKFLGESDKDINVENQAKLSASLMTKLNSLSSDRIKINNYREITTVAMGSEPLKFTSADDVKRFLDFKDSGQLAKAELLARNYSAKDITSLNQLVSPEFSASDVALLKVNVAHTPYIELANTDQTDVNSKINVIGFPSDAENQLTENDRISPTVTSGTISAKRSANGATGKLFQSDVDASQGNSGGPAINQSGQAIGLLTYRYKDDANLKTSSSYIRDINDIKNLAKKENITIGGDNSTAQAWQRGLANYSERYYSSAQRDLVTSQKLFPSNRLANSYILKANQEVEKSKSKGILTENYFVQIGYEVGILGLIIFLSWLVYILRLLRKNVIIISAMAGLILMNTLFHTWANEAVAASVFIFIGLQLPRARAQLAMSK